MGAHGVLVPGSGGAGFGALAVAQAALVEFSRRERRDGRVHAVLRVQHLLQTSITHQVALLQC